MDAHLPTGTVTFVFTDIEGSTQLWERFPRAMQAGLVRHDELLRTAIESHQGFVIKTTGDGVHAVFASARNAVQAVLAAQRAIFNESWSDMDPIRVRVGMHTGEDDLRSGDYYGQAVIRAARLMSLGAGGQILISQATASLVRDTLPDGLVLHELGEYTLKGLSQPERVYQVNVPDLPSDFPLLKSFISLPNNLPVQLTSFVGRQQELAEIKQLLAKTHMLTLTGSGGTGKTRLSLQLAEDVLSDFQDGIWFVELAPLTDAVLVLHAIAAALLIPEQSGRAVLDALTDYLRSKHMLLILDNCEHLLEACADAANKLLLRCPKLQILASSREALGINGETTFMVPSLSLPDLQAGRLGNSEAERLFIERAQSAVPGFSPTEQEAIPLAQICCRLDGIPLAIELAAARIKYVSLEQLAVRLDDRFRILTGGSRTALPRQQTLRALIDWSYDLLSPPERTAMRHLSVFAGGWTLDGAEAILEQAIAPLDVIEIIFHLVNKSLVVMDNRQISATRYRLLETIRQYAREKLLESGEGEAARDLHLAFYHRLAEIKAPDFLSPKQLQYLDWCEAEHDNLRAALDWGLESNPDAALELVGSIAMGWTRRGITAELQQLLLSARSKVEALPEASGDEGQRRKLALANATLSLGITYMGQGKNEEAFAALLAALVHFRLLGSGENMGLAYGSFTLVAAFRGDPKTIQYLDEGETWARERGNIPGLAFILGNRAIFQFLRNDLQLARQYNDESLRLAREIGAPWILAQPLLNAARIFAIEGRYGEARKSYRDAREIYVPLRDAIFINIVDSELAHLDRQQGNTKEAQRIYQGTIQRWLELKQLGAVAHQLECFAFLAVGEGDFVRCTRLFGAAESLRQNIHSRMQSNEQAEYDAQLENLRSRLDQGAITAAWAEGAALTLEAAVDYAVTGKWID